MKAREHLKGRAVGKKGVEKMLHVDILCSEIEEEKKFSENKMEERYSKELNHKKENVSTTKHNEIVLPENGNETVDIEENKNENEVE